MKYVKELSINLLILFTLFIASSVIFISDNYTSENTEFKESSNENLKISTIDYNGIPICTESDDQYEPQICSDEAGGAFITWSDYRSDFDDHVYTQRIDSTGVVNWTSNGEVISTSLEQDMSQICSDEAGGAIIIWMDIRGPSSPDIYAQRVNSTGDEQWTLDGEEICTFSSVQWGPRICTDEAGGAIIAWIDTRTMPKYHIYAQRINSSGDIKWTNDGEAIYTGDDLQLQGWPQICSDGSGGAIITWVDNRSGPDSDIYAQRINSTGGIEWTLDGEAICTAVDLQVEPQICSDGDGGAIITWTDVRSGDPHIYAQRINSSGGVEWTPDGEVICTAFYVQFMPQIVSDGDGGAIISWTDYRGISAISDIYAQRINSSGDIQWTPDGEAICTASDDQGYLQICSDGSEGAIITWEDYRGGSYFDIYVQRINSTGGVEWTPDGVAISKASDDQWEPQICSDGSGGAIITWEDYRGGSYSDIYAQKVNSTGDVQWSLIVPAGVAVGGGGGGGGGDDDKEGEAIPGYDIFIIISILSIILIFRIKTQKRRIK